MGKKACVRDMMHFFGIEEENALISFVNLGNDIFLIHNLDIIYRKCLKLKPIDDPKLKIPAFLFLNVHRELYLGIASLLRLHQSKAFCSLRAALDSVFTAYYLLRQPDKIEVYLSRISEEPSKEWKKIFQNIKETIKRDIEKFPLAKGLPEIHELCSIYSHSDPLGIMHRYCLDKERLFLTADYFDYEDTAENYKTWLGGFLFGFFRIYLIFWKEMFEQRAGGEGYNMNERISIYKDKLDVFMKKYPFKKLAIAK